MTHHHLLAPPPELAGWKHTAKDRRPDPLGDLIEALRRAVSGSAGFELVIVHSGHPVSLTVTEPMPEIRASMRVPLSLLSPSYGAGGRAVFYSTVPGAFVDLAASFNHNLTPPGQSPNVVALDVDLPQKPVDQMLTGLDELAVLHRAAGVLIEQGHHPDSADQVLIDQAREQSLSTVAFARRLLGC